MNVQLLIGEYLKSHGIKQAYVADKCGWSKQKTNAILRGRQKISVEEFVKVCDAIDTPYDFFLNSIGKS